MLPLAMAAVQCGSAAMAQNLQDRPVAAPTAADISAPLNDKEVGFSSDQLDYDDKANIVTASGDVRMIRAGSRLRANRVVWNRGTGAVRAEGNVVVVNPGGDTAYSDSADLTDTLKDGVAENMLLVLEDGGRLAAAHGTRVNGVSTLSHATYSPCAVTSNNGCPKTPLWTINAVRVVHDPARHRISYRDARFTILGVTVLWLPAFSNPDGQQKGGGSGLLVPNFQVNNLNGAEFAQPYYLQFGPNSDLLATPQIYTKVAPALGLQYRRLTSNGAYQVGGLITYGSRDPAQSESEGASDRGIRGYLEANGKFQLDPYWSVTGSLRVTTDSTFLRRYDLSNDDRLRSSVNVERIDDDSYLSIAGYAVQVLQTGSVQGQQPFALPAIDYRRRLTDPLLGGVVDLQANSLDLIRTDGQDTQRVFAGAQWNLTRYTTLGQQITLTGYVRGDLYHSDNSVSTATVSYRGRDGWTPRAIVAGAVDMRWPFAGQLFGGTQVITPRIEIVGTPELRNSVVPDEDSRSVDLDATNLFALNRFSGYDRFEDNSRLVYGLEWTFDRPRLSIRSMIGQSFRLTNYASIFPDGTGLSDQFSDIVAETTIRYGRFARLSESIRIDKDSAKIRRNEVDATVGGQKTYLTVGYLRLNRDIDTAIEDLRDHEEVSIGGRIQVTRTLSVFGSTVIDLTSAQEDPTSTADGYQPVRQRVGVQYDNECLSLGVSYRRDYDTIGDTKRGSTFAIRLALKNLGR